MERELILSSYQRQKTNRWKKRDRRKRKDLQKKGETVREKMEKAATWQQRMTAGKEKNKALTCAFGPAVH